MNKFLITAAVFAFSLFMAITFPITASATNADNLSSRIGGSLTLLVSCATISEVSSDTELNTRFESWSDQLTETLVAVIKIQVKESSMDMTDEEINEWVENERLTVVTHTLDFWSTLDDETKTGAYDACIDIAADVERAFESEQH